MISLHSSYGLRLLEFLMIKNFLIIKIYLEKGVIIKL